VLLGACREKAVEKPAGSDSNEISDELVSPKPVATIAPFAGKLVLDHGSPSALLVVCSIFLTRRDGGNRDHRGKFMIV
jgi:hypothetical protein